MADQQPRRTRNAVTHVQLYYGYVPSGKGQPDKRLTAVEMPLLAKRGNAHAADVRTSLVNYADGGNKGNSAFRPQWEAARGDAAAAIADTTDPYCAFDALIVDRSGGGEAGSDSVAATEGDITYALFTKRVPVLVLVDAASDADALLLRHCSHTLLTVAVVTVESTAHDAIAAFLTFPDVFGRLVVVEGGDGAGKQTQVALLCEALNRLDDGTRAETLDFPHDAADYGILIRELLSGKLGNIKQVNPLIFAAIYGLNRHATLPTLKYWLQRGRVVVLDRYMTANFGHQASKYDTDAERNAAIATLATFEHQWLRLPPADKVFYLNLPPDYALRAMQADGTRGTLDMHELAGIEYKNNVRKAFLWCCGNFPEWEEVRCVNGTGEVAGAEGAPEGVERRFTRAEVHATLLAAVTQLLGR